MFRRVRVPLAVFLVVALGGLHVEGKDALASLQEGSPDLQSAGPLAFGPAGILFVADPRGAAVFAIATGEKASKGKRKALKVEGIDAKVAGQLGASPRQVRIIDLAISPHSGKAYLSVMRGQGPDASPVILCVDDKGKIDTLSLEKVKFSKAQLPNPPAPGAERRGRSLRGQSVTDMAYLNGRLLVAGLSNEEFASTLRSIPFPFDKVGKGTGVKIYHGAHGKFETHSPVRTFVPFDVGDASYVFAAYTCTPLVKFPVDDLKPGAQVQGTTIAELGNRNRPLDMIAYKKGEQDFLLIANSSRGIMKVSTENIDKAEGITERVARGETQGQPYETIAQWKGIAQLDALDEKHAVVLRRTDDGAVNLETLALP